MTVKNDLIQAVRGWLKTLGTLTDEQVVKADSDQARPPLPYLTVRMLAYDIQVGDDERRTGLDGGGLPVASVRGQRLATVTVQAFGAGADDWISDAKLSLRKESIRAILLASGIAVRQINGQSNIAAIIADKIELRSTNDFTLGYSIESTEETEAELLTVVFTNTFGDRESVQTVTL